MAFNKGFNFRSTSGFVTDGASETYVINSDIYPTVRNGVTFGWVTTAPTGWDGVNTNDRRLAGNNQTVNNGTQRTFRADLPVGATYQVQLAQGDPSFAQAAMYLQLQDNGTPLLTLNQTTTTGSQRFFDATNTLYTNVTWPTSETAAGFSFATTTLLLILGTPTAGSNSSGVAHLFVSDGAVGGGWASIGTRCAPAKAGPYDRRGFILSPYQQYSYVSSVTTFLVSSADGFTLYESLDGANALVSATVQEESVASVAQAQAIIEEAIASLAQTATVQTEALQGLALVQAVIEESLASAANAVTVKEESTGLIALGATAQDESLASAANAATVQDESLATATAGQTVIEEALATATAAVAVRYEALATALLSQIVQYEAGGIASSPVSNSVVVAIEALASATQSATNRLEALQQIAITAAVVDELLASATSSVTVRAETTQGVALLLSLIYESGGLPLGVPMLGINAIVFAAMVTLAALDLMTTAATSDSLATAAASDFLVTLGVTDSLTTKSVFDG